MRRPERLSSGGVQTGGTLPALVRCSRMIENLGETPWGVSLMPVGQVGSGRAAKEERACHSAWGLPAYRRDRQFK